LHEKDYRYFELLKQKIAEVMKKTYPGINPEIGEWKGQEITDFQEDLRIRANATISEKWFYTHMKSTHTSLPRIDMLNILSMYAGYANWDDFIYRNAPREPRAKSRPETGNRYFVLVPLITLGIIALVFLLFRLFSTQEYSIRFLDADTQEPISGSRIEVSILADGESPVQYLSGTDGVLHFKTGKSRIRMVVRAPYYQADTIVRMVTRLNRRETVMLKPDDYALMIHYFSTMKVDDWQKRRQRLDGMIDDGAMICQVVNGPEATGMALYNKEEFIDKLTIPSGSLKNLEVLGTRTRDGKIVLLRFRIKDSGK
jgi:hypothetical protein